MGRIIAITLGAVFTACAAIAIYAVLSFTTAPSDSSETIIIDVPPGSSFSSVAKNIFSKGLVRNELLFKVYAKALGYTKSIHVGEYEMRRNMSPATILNVLASGKSITYSITVPEGYNIFEITQVIKKLWPQKAERFLKLTRDPQFASKKLGYEVSSLEGYLFPNTYNMTKYMKVEELIDLMLSQFEIAFSQIPKNEIFKKFKRHEIVTLASVIEKETGAPEERPMISSVFHNRLNKGMRLQSDPTIIYGVWVQTGEYLKNIRKSHIKGPTPYNTYTVKALPHGPIANPGIEALRAVVQPDTTEFLYFVSRNDGTHVFSKTYEEHNKAVRDYQLNRSARQGKSWRDRTNN